MKKQKHYKKKLDNLINNNKLLNQNFIIDLINKNNFPPYLDIS